MPLSPLLLLLACGAHPPGSDAAPPDSAPPDSAPPDSAPPDSGPSDSGDSGDSADPAGLPTGPFVIGFWCGPPAAELTAARMAEIAAAGFTRVSNACDGATYTPDYNRTLLALAEAAGLDAVVTDTRGLAAGQGTDVAANVAALVADYGGSPALAGYHLYDEPGAAAFPALGEATRALAAADPGRLASVNLFPDYASEAQLGAAAYDAYVAAFLDQVGPPFFTYDHYPFLADGTDGATFFQNLASVRAQALPRGAAWGQYLQAIAYDGHRATTAAEKRWSAMHTLAYGGTGIYYFTYWTPPPTAEDFGDGILAADGTPTAQYAEVAEINAALRVLLPVLAGAASTAVFHNGPLAAGATPRVPGEVAYLPSAAPVTVGVFAAREGALVLVVNRDHHTTTTTDLLLAAGDGGVRALDVATGAFEAVAAVPDPLGARVSLALAPGDARLFHLPAPGEGPVGAEAYFGAVRDDAGWLDVVDARFGTARLRAAGWYDCPTGTQAVGADVQSDGFWLCAADALAGRTWYVGNVVDDVGALYRVSAGVTTPLGPAGWDTCPAGTLVGHRFASDGYWVCLE